MATSDSSSGSDSGSGSTSATNANMKFKGPIALALCGKSPTMATAFMSALDGEEYKVIHVCHTLSAAKNELPSLLRGSSITPTSSLSTLSSTSPPLPREIPRAIIIGKGFSEQEMQDIISSCTPSGLPSPSSSSSSASASTQGTQGQSAKEKEGEAERVRVAWLLPDDEKFTLAMKAKAVLTAGAMLPGVIAERVREALGEHGVVPGGEWEERVEGPVVWRF